VASTDTERALEEALRERARLWEQLHEQRALEREADHLRSKVARMENSRSGRLTKPLRSAKRWWDILTRRLSSPD
jgi:poly-gamma-glutamate capsule biosynthesis protein CapA/YwtB (metallophosphatase superfamily)